MAALRQVASAFTRRLLNEDHTLIASRCKSCGALIVSSVMDGLEEQESEHCEHCPGTKGSKFTHTPHAS